MIFDHRIHDKYNDGTHQSKVCGIFETLMQVAARVMEKMGAYCSNFFVLSVTVNLDRDWHEKFVI
jgi:hypothetical protein